MTGREGLLDHLRSMLRDGPREDDFLVVLRPRRLTSIEALQGPAAARRVLETMRRRATELGGAEGFVADMGDATLAIVRRIDKPGLDDFLHRMVDSLSRPMAEGGAPLYAPANVGACPVQASIGDAAMHLDRAMRALQQAMARGPGTVELVSDARAERAAADWEMRSLLAEAGLRGEFLLEYQTIHSLAGDGVSRVEALLRWQSAEFGRVGPDRFVPMLEESGLIRPVGEWVLRNVCLQAGEWRAAMRAPVRVAVNVSPMQLVAGFQSSARRILAETGCEADWIELEITEGALVRDFARIEARLAALAALGFTLAIDDFGAGYSSLGQLAQLPVHELKMDRSLIEGVPGALKRAGIVKAVVALAEGLGLGVTAEGVEHAQQAEWLSRFPGMQGQGYFFSRPASAEAVGALLS